MAYLDPMGLSSPAAQGMDDDQSTLRGNRHLRVVGVPILLSLSIFGCGGGDNPVGVTVVMPGSVAFISERDGNDEIYVIDTDGSNQVNLTNNAAHDFGPVWSPDGSKIAFWSERDGNIEIYVMDTDGSNQVNLTNNAAHDLNPVWSLVR